MTPVAATADAQERFVARWVAATFAGWVVGFGLVLVLSALSGLMGLGGTQFPVGLGMGAGVGLLQARLVGRRVGGARPWLVASAGGMAAPFVASDLASVLGVPVPYSLSACVALGGLVVGLLQWRVLARVSSDARWWIVAAPVGWTLAASTVFIADRFLPRIPGLLGASAYVAIVLTGGVALGAVGAHALRRIVTGSGRAPSRGEAVAERGGR